MLSKSFSRESRPTGDSSRRSANTIGPSFSHELAVAAKAARQKDRQQNFGSKTRHDTLNTNQVGHR